jgi:hypothetical protein
LNDYLPTGFRTGAFIIGQHPDRETTQQPEQIPMEIRILDLDFHGIVVIHFAA